MTNLHPILIVDDDEALRSTLAERLRSGDEFAPTEAGSIEEAERILALSDQRFDAIILDVGLPDGDGRTFCAHLREAGQTVPIIMLSGWAAEQDVVLGLESGANDYVVKPFRLAELVARLRVHLLNYESSDYAVLQIGPYTFRPSMKQLHEPIRNKRIRLTDKEAGILKFLYRAGGDAVERKILLNGVWGYNPAATTHTLESHVSSLRQKIEPEPARPSLLISERGCYRLMQTINAGASHIVANGRKRTQLPTEQSAGSR